MNIQPLNKTDSTLLKGIGILMIVVHNFMHWLPGPQEMEFAFHEGRFLAFFSWSADQPQNILQYTFSFFGHFGVQIFIFLSAYGLTRKYMSDDLRFGGFMAGRLKTLYPSFLLAILLWAIVTERFEFGPLGPIKQLYWNTEALLWKVSMLSNFLEDERLNLVGPWWFMSFIFQFYLIFPLLLRGYQKLGARLLFLLSTATVVVSIWSQGELAGVNLYFTVIGHLPEICLGIYMADPQHEGKKLPALTVPAAATIFIAGNLIASLWHVNHISFLILILAALVPLLEKMRAGSHLQGAIAFFGSISMYLFLVNGFLRQPFIDWAKAYDHWLATTLLCLLFLVVAVLFSLILKKSEALITVIGHKMKRRRDAAR